mgnify:CR=1 FL=1
MKELYHDGVCIKLGQNAIENLKLIKEAHKDYLWIHLKSFRSGHVIIQDHNPSQNVIDFALRLCLNGTKQKNMQNVVGSITTVSNIRLTNEIGEVEFKSNKKVYSKKIGQIDP